MMVTLPCLTTVKTGYAHSLPRSKSRSAACDPQYAKSKVKHREAPPEAVQASAGAKRSREGRSRAHICEARRCCVCARPHNVQQLRHEALQVLDLQASSSRKHKAESC